MSGARPSSFGARLRHYREAAGLSQEDLAERAGLAAKAIGALERGERRRPYPRTVQMLADALQLDEPQRREFIAAVPRSPTTTLGEAEVFVGRERELGELTAKLRAAAGGHGGIVMVVGEAGIGKTHLVSKFMSVARADGAVVLSGRALEGDGQAPYGPWVEAIERYAGERDPDELRGVLGADAPYLAELAVTLRSRVGDLPRPAVLGPNDERLRLYGAITRFCSTIAAETPVLVALDDLHWADRDTLGVMRYMARSLTGSRVLLVGVYRDPELGVDAEHPLMTTLASVRHDVACPTIRLSGLGPDEFRSYLSHAAGQSLPPAFVDHVKRETSGNPFYAREVLRHVTETEVDTATSAGPRTFAIEGVPEGVRQVVGDRVRRLSPSTARLLQDASALTGGFTFRVLMQLTQLSEGALLDCLDEAIGAGLLRAAADRADEYEFTHAIVRHALYETQNRDRRVRLHRRVAQALEATYLGEALAHAPELAQQYHLSAELPGASAGLPYALAAATQARNAFAHDRVVISLRMAHDLAGDTDMESRIEILTRLALAEAETVRSSDACVTADRALQTMTAAGLTEHARAEFLATIGQALKDSGAAPQLWEPLVDRGIELVQSEHGTLWARLMLLRDRYSPVRSGTVGCGIWMGQNEDAVALARTSGDEGDYVQTLEALEWRTRAETDAIRAQVRGWSRPVALLKAHQVVLRDLTYRHGDFPAALLCAQDLLAVAQRFGSLSAEAEARAQIAVCTLGLGELGSIAELNAEAQQAIARLGPNHRLHLIPIGMGVGLGYFMEADWGTVVSRVEEYARTTDAQRNPTGFAAAAYAALALVRANRLTDARAWLHDLAAAASHAPARTYLLNWALTAGAAAVWEAELVDPARTYRTLLLGLEDAGAGSPTVFGNVDLAVARMATLVGDHGEARERFARAAQDAERAGHRALQAITAFDEAWARRRSSASDAQVAALAARANRTFEALGMRSWARRTRSLESTPHLAAARRPNPSAR